MKSPRSSARARAHTPARLPTALLALALGAAAVGFPGVLHAVHPEYSNLLALGKAAYDRKAYPVAIRNLRLACFGMLDEPKVLADCLARLALAQDRANDVEGFQQTFQRLAEIEEKFSAYTQADLQAELRSALEPRIVARIPAATLEGTAGFRFLAPRKAESQVAAKGLPGKTNGKPAPPAAPPNPGASVPATEKPKPPPTTATPPPPDPVKPKTTSAIASGPAASAIRPAPGSTGAVPTGPPATPALRPWTESEKDKLQQAREKLSTEQTARELKTIFDNLREIAEAHPEAREAQHLAGQAAYRLSRWPEAVSYFKRGGDPGEDQAELLFYIAVSLYESGDPTGAAATLKRSLPNLRRTAYVDKYAKKILGQ